MKKDKGRKDGFFGTPIFKKRMDKNECMKEGKEELRIRVTVLFWY